MSIQLRYYSPRLSISTNSNVFQEQFVLAKKTTIGPKKKRGRPALVGDDPESWDAPPDETPRAWTKEERLKRSRFSPLNQDRQLQRSASGKKAARTRAKNKGLPEHLVRTCVVVEQENKLRASKIAGTFSRAVREALHLYLLERDPEYRRRHEREHSNGSLTDLKESLRQELLEELRRDKDAE